MKCYKDGDLRRREFRFNFGDRLCIDICPENEPHENYLNDLKEYINEKSIKKIFINSSFQNQIDISFLYDMNTIEDIQLSALVIDLNPIYAIKPKVLHIQTQRIPLEFEKLKDRIEDLSIYNLNPNHITGKKLDEKILLCIKLKKFGISYFDKKDSEIIGQMTWLENLDIAFCSDKKFNVEVFGGLNKLKELNMQQIPFESFSLLNSLTELEKITITKLNLTSLQGIENFKNLKYLSILYCSKLVNLSQIISCSKLKKIEFNTCKKIKSFESLSALKEVQGLVISNCGNIPSLNFLKNMSGLKFLSFVDTNIVDGDLTECLKLQCVGTFDKRHYNLKSKDLPNNHDYGYWNI